MVSCRVFVFDVESKRCNDQLHLLFSRNKLIEEKIYLFLFLRRRRVRLEGRRLVTVVLVGVTFEKQAFYINPLL